MTPEQIAELEALVAKADGKFYSVEKILDADRTLNRFLREHLPAILAALKAQQPDEAMVERVATVLAPFVCRPVHNGDCDDIAAGQSHARYVARTAIAALKAQQPGEDVVERVARVIDPGSWAVMDGYLADMKRKYRGQNAAYDPDNFKHKGSMATARAAIAAMQENPDEG